MKKMSYIYDFEITNVGGVFVPKRVGTFDGVFRRGHIIWVEFEIISFE